MAKECTTEMPFLEEYESWTLIEKIRREGACKMLQQAFENEIEEYLIKHAGTDEKGHRLVVRNGYHHARDIVTGIGPMTVKAPRVDDRKIDPEREQPFTSAIRPRYLRKVPNVDNLLPVLYSQRCLYKRVSKRLGFNPWRGSKKALNSQYRTAEEKLGR